MYKLDVKMTGISDGGGAHPAPVQGVRLVPEQEEGLQGREVLPGHLQRRQHEAQG